MNTLYRAILTASAAVILCSGNMRADTIIGVFSNPVVQGYVADYPAVGSSTYFDNTGTAVSFIDNVNNPTLGGTPPQQQYGNFVLWGSADSSEVDFFGAQIPGDPSTPFQIGTFTFNNGYSALNQLVFGFTISFYDTTVGPTSFLGSDTMVITTTQDLSGAYPGDDDYVNFCGTFSSICGTSIEAVEASEGGTGVTAVLYGTITGDPTLTITSAALAPGQTGAGNGFIGTDPAIGAIGSPEPGTWMMLLFGASILGIGLARRKSAAKR
jgi:hypothetical protein